MPKVIIEDEYYEELKAKIAPEISKVRGTLLEENKTYFQSNSFLEENTVDRFLQEIGRVIPVSLAWEKMTNFSPVPNNNRKSLPIKLVIDFIEFLKGLVPQHGFELGIRIHTGYSNTGSNLNFFMMPIWVSDSGHEYDLEESIFNDDIPFFGIDADDPSKFIKDYRGRQKIKYKDQSGKTGVVFTLNTLEDFIGGYAVNDIAFVEFLSARESRGNYGLLTLVIRGVSSNGTILLSSGKSKGYYFDQGDLIPPPPANDTSF